ncbi:MAG: dihydrolipoyl dehydrogenase [Acidobacteriota bacterium]|nr:dihydrolipoyl dehydrogenase [Acidobacteriota bacterium]
MTEVLRHDLVVVGAGPGGYAAAFLAADLGMDVILIDPEPNPGGVCLFRGCIPSKSLLHVAKLIHEAEQAEEWGVVFGKPNVDLDRLRGFKQDVVDRLTGGLGQLATQRKVPHLRGMATIVGPTELDVERVEGGSVRVEFGHAILATGSRPTELSAFPNEDPRLMDSTAALEMDELPETLLVVGGGYIGLELGSVYSALGSRVTVVEMTDGLLPGADRDLVRPLAKRLEAQFEAIRLSTKVATIDAADDGLHVSLEPAEGPAESHRFDRVLVAIGRRPNSGGIGLETTKVQIDGDGFVSVDAQLRTTEPTLFAIGDLVGQPMLAHKASHEARVAVEAIAGEKVAFDPAAIPAVVFTDPEVAWCGLTETEAKLAGRKIEVARFPWGASGRARTIGREDGLTKLILDPQTERVLGMGIVGAGAGELIAEGVLAVEMAALAGDLRLTIHPHPTLSETVMESAEVYFGQSTHVYRPSRRR